MLQEANNERARNAASGDPVGPKNTDVPDPEDYGYGAPAATAQHGEVIAYTPRRKEGRIIIPLTIHNGGSKQTAYTVTITATGSEANSPLSVTASAPNVFPGTTWPTQVDLTAAGARDLQLDVSLTVTKDIFPYGDAH
ncbi:hypothetical protein [Streptomyces sp. NPDC003374]